MPAFVVSHGGILGVHRRRKGGRMREVQRSESGIRWFTIDEFEDRKPENLYHKEQEEGTDWQETVKNLHVLARTHVKAREEDRCLLRISADDYYKLYVNGAYVAQGPAPAYPEYYYYNEMDLTDYLTEGDNVIAVHLYYQGAVNRVWNSGDGRFGLGTALFWCRTGEDSASEDDVSGGCVSENGMSEACVPEDGMSEACVPEDGMSEACVPEDGMSEDCVPDNGMSEIGVPQELVWRYHRCDAYSGEAIGYETQYLEDFDSILWDEDWNQVGFDDSGWKSMKPARWADYGMERQPTRLLACYTRTPKTVTETEDGCLIDVGEEITGGLRLVAEGKKGQQVTLCYGEELTEDGRVRYEMRCNCTYEERWTLNGKTCSNEPYDYKGFRYVQVIPDPGVRIRDIRIEIRHYPMEDSLCTLRSSEPMLDRIFQICKNGVKYGTQEGFLDCPTREKGQYLGDAVVTAHAHVWLSGSADMMEKCIRQFARSRMICPGLLGVAPGNFMQEIADFSLLWSQMVLNHYRFTGDGQFLSEMYPVARGVLEHFSQYEGENGLLWQVADKWNLVDWPENLRDEYDFALSRPVVAPGCHNVINALYTGAWKTLAEMEEILGLEPNRKWESLNEAYLKAFFRPEQGLLADSTASGHCALHSNLYALYFGLIPDKKTRGRIAAFLLEKGFCCGVFTSYFVLHGLANAGYREEAYKLLLNDSEHGWVNMVREGATTCFEAWGKEQKWNTSLCHPWACAPVSFFIEQIAGIRPDPSAERGFSFEPHVPEELEGFELHVSVRGISYVVRKHHSAVKLEAVCCSQIV